MPSPFISIIIPVFNNIAYTQKCLEAIFHDPPEVKHEILVVDNASSDGTAEYLTQLQNRIRVISNQQNLGFAKACNQGALAAEGDYLLFLNNDTIPLSGWLDALIKTMQEDPFIGAAGSKLLYPDNTIQHAGVAFIPHQHVKMNGKEIGTMSLPCHLARGLPADCSEAGKSQVLQAVTGACLLVSKVVFEQAGRFDETFRNGWEDLDLCFKIGTEGLKIYYCSESVLYHFEEKTPGRHDSEFENMQHFISRWSAYIGGNAVAKNLNAAGTDTNSSGPAQPSKTFMDCTGAYYYSPSQLPDIVNRIRQAGKIPVIRLDVKALKIVLKFFFLRIGFIIPVEPVHGYYELSSETKSGSSHPSPRTKTLGAFEFRAQPVCDFEEDFVARCLGKFFEQLHLFRFSVGQPVNIEKGSSLVLLAQPGENYGNV